MIMSTSSQKCLHQPVDVLQDVALADEEEVLHGDDVVHGVSEDLGLGYPARLEHLAGES